MKLYNRSPIDDKVLKALLAKAARSVGARHGKVLVEIGHGDTLHGIAYDYIWKRVGKRRVRCNGGLQITLPTRRMTGDHKASTERRRSLQEYWSCWYGGDPLRLAGQIYDVARHEFAHVRDYHNAEVFQSPHTKAGRRVRWAERPVEQSAMAACEDADALGRGHEWAADEILDLAIALEALGAREGRR